MTQDANSYIAAVDEDQTDKLTVGDFIKAIRERARIVWGTIAAIFVLTFLILLIKPPLYTATIIVAPAPSSTAKGATASSALSSISGLIGGSTATTSTPLQPIDEFMQLIISPRVAQKVIDADPTVLQKVFFKEWDPVTKQWHPPTDVFSTFQRFVCDIFGLPSWSKPSAQRLATYLSTGLEISEVSTTPMQEISFTFKDPKFAVDLLQHLDRWGDAIVRDEAMMLADKQIDYLQKKLDQTTSIDYRQTLLSLLASQVTTRMTINSNLPYAASVVQPAVASDLPTSPNPVIWLSIAIVVGALFGIFLALGAALIWPDGVPQSTFVRDRVLAPIRRIFTHVTSSSPSTRPNEK
jgi:uncharacterized protein involved in exopolysaccharide biosynthesis